MESCLLCLDGGNASGENIQINSLQWQAGNMKYLIEKHLWTMDDMQTSGFVCISCWHEIETFHKFYLRIKDAHSVLASTEAKNVNETTNFDRLSSVLKNKTIESNIETDILLVQPLSTEYVAENETFLIRNEILREDLPLKQGRKRGRPSKNVINNNNEDPLKKPNISRTLKKGILFKKTFKDNENEDSKVENVEITAQNLKVTNIVLGAKVNFDFESEFEVQNKKQQSDLLKKKRKNPDEKTRKEHDKIIDEYFKIFCSLCQIPIENFVTLRKHFREEHEKRGFVICCKKKIFTRPILVDHIRFHLDPNYFKCKYCGKVYSDRCTLDSHNKIHQIGQLDRNYICDNCGKSFVGTSQLETHKLIHAPDYEKKYSCDDCGKFFTTLYSLNYHIQAIHHNKYVKICDICGKTMRCRNSFKLHMEKHDTKLSSPIYCDVCGLRLIDRRGLRRHKNSQHPVGGKKEYSCHICSKTSPNLRALRTHIRFAHETGYIHKCTMCDKAFKRSEALKEHLATHTGTPLYTCPWCPKTFISNGNMHNHRKKSHPKEWEEAQRQKYGGLYPPNCKIQINVNSNNNI